MNEIQAITAGLTSLKTAMDITKSLKGLDKAISDADFKFKIVELSEKLLEVREKLLEVQEENLSLRSRIDELKRQSQDKVEMIHKSPFYFKEGDNVPYCPKCWEGNKKTVHLIAKPWNRGTRHDCPVCDFKDVPKASTIGAITRRSKFSKY